MIAHVDTIETITLKIKVYVLLSGFSPNPPVGLILHALTVVPKDKCMVFRQNHRDTVFGGLWPLILHNYASVL